MKPASSTVDASSTLPGIQPGTRSAISPPVLPRILLVEDDPASRAFLSAAASAVPADVDSADSMAAALVLAASQRYDLWLFDAQLPDGSGIELLHRLRALQPNQATPPARPPALAHTACTEPATHDALRSAGFLQVLVKPLSAGALRVSIQGTLGLSAFVPATVPGTRNVLPAVAGESVPVWDDAGAALALNGNHAHIQTLRGLFLQELPHVHQRVVVAVRAGDIDAARHDLHKLRASCGFVGASRLAAAVRTLQQRPDDAESLVQFEIAARVTSAPVVQNLAGSDQVPPSP